VTRIVNFFGKDSHANSRNPWVNGCLLRQKPSLKPKGQSGSGCICQARPVTWLCSTSLWSASYVDAISPVLRVRDVLVGGTVAASRAIVMQLKTQRPVQFEITEPSREALAAWGARQHLRRGDFHFPGRRADAHLSLRKYARVVNGVACEARLDPADTVRIHSGAQRRLSSTSARKTVEQSSCSSSTRVESTVRYLAMEVDDALEISEQVEI
jgi:hypothetical protein